MFRAWGTGEEAYREEKKPELNTGNGPSYVRGKFRLCFSRDILT